MLQRIKSIHLLPEAMESFSVFVVGWHACCSCRRYFPGRDGVAFCLLLLTDTLVAVAADLFSGKYALIELSLGAAALASIARSLHPHSLSTSVDDLYKTKQVHCLFFP